MKLIIDIDEKIIQQAKHYHDLPYDDYVVRVAEAIANGTPLPKGHGRLIDGDDLCKGWMSDDQVVKCAKRQPTIIEADTERSEDAKDSD